MPVNANSNNCAASGNQQQTISYIIIYFLCAWTDCMYLRTHSVCSFAECLSRCVVVSGWQKVKLFRFYDAPANEATGALHCQRIQQLSRIETRISCLFSKPRGFHTVHSHFNNLTSKILSNYLFVTLGVVLNTDLRHFVFGLKVMMI